MGGCEGCMVKELEHRSIFDELKEFYENNSGELYSYQDFGKCGLSEFNILSYKTNKLRLYEKNRLASDFVKLFFETAEDAEMMETIEKFAKEHPVINYYKSLQNLVKGICEDKEKKKTAGRLVFEITHKSRCSELIKAAITICSIVEIFDLEEMLKVYSIHNDYLCYVLDAYEIMGLSNSTFFEIAKKSRGYGRFFAVMHLKPVTYEIIDWMITEGCDNDVAATELVYVDILSVDMLDYLKKTDFSMEKVEKIARAFSIMLSDYGLNEIKDEDKVCTILLNEIEKYPGGIYSLYATISILYSLEADLIEYYKDKQINKQMTLYNKYRDILDTCRRICTDDVWESTLDAEITNIEREPSVLITCAEKIGYKIRKKDFETLFKRDYTNALLYKYAFAVGNKGIKKSVYNLAVKKLKINELTSGPAEFTIDKLRYEDIEHICFFIMTKYMTYEDFEEEYKDFNMKALRSPLVETRIQAATNLERFKGQFEPDEIDYLKQSAVIEMVSSIKRGLNSLIMDEDKNMKKTIPVEKHSDITVHVRDIYLTSVMVNDSSRYNHTELFNKMQEDDMVYIAEDEADGENEVFVTTDNGVVIGTLPISIKGIIKNMIDKGKYFYGKVESISDDYQEITISIIMSYKDVLDDIGDTLMLLSNENNEYVQ